MDVAEAGFGLRGLDAQRHDRPLLRLLSSLRDEAPEGCRVADVVVGRKDREHLIGPPQLLAHKDGGHADAGRRVPALRLSKDVGDGEPCDGLCDGISQVLRGHHHHLILRHQPLKAVHRLGDHGLVAKEAEQLFGTVAAAQRPETGTGSAGHDDCMHGELRTKKGPRGPNLESHLAACQIHRERSTAKRPAVPGEPVELCGTQHPRQQMNRAEPHHQRYRHAG